jgi:sulfide:quinone oxidoreductase
VALRVLIAGGGIAGLEAGLALRALAGELVEIELLSPSDRFLYKPMLVAEPFGGGGETSLRLAPILANAHARLRQGSLVKVETSARLAITDAGDRIAYEALLVALGARPVDAVLGALNFGFARDRARFAELLAALGRRGTRRLAFVVPPHATWSIAAYELALLTAAERDARRITGVELSVVTHEPAPLARFGGAASELVASTLHDAGVTLRTACAAERFDAGELRLANRQVLEFDEVIALPRLEVATVRGLPQREHGFLATDGQMQVEGLEDVWAAGDATALPIKQGGLAAQQADIAASAIAARAGADVEVERYRPVLRAALITGDTPEFMEAPVGDPDAGLASVGSVAWAARTKLSASHLGPYLTGALGGIEATHETELRRQAIDLQGGGDAHDRAVKTLLIAADADAATGDFETALAWLAVVEQLNFVIPAAYVARRADWRRELNSKLGASRAAARIDGRFANAEGALSDLRRRIGWLREVEARTGGEMQAHLVDFERDVDHLVAMSRRTGTLRTGRS